MDFIKVTTTLLQDFAAANIRYAVIGGYALGFWGVTRATVDMDFLLLFDDADAADEIFSKHGFVQTYRSENVAQYKGADASFGTIDLIFAFREVSTKMLSRRVDVSLGDGLTLQSLIPEDIIGLKIQAIANDPAREQKDMADIKALLAAANEQGRSTDWNSLKEYFTLFEFDELYREMETDYRNA